MGEAGEVVDLAGVIGRGPAYGLATDDLNLTLLVWGPDEEVAEHVNDERDVAYVVVAGSGWLRVDGALRALEAPCAIVVPRGAARQLLAGPDGIRYVTVHRARGGLRIAAPPRAER